MRLTILQQSAELMAILHWQLPQLLRTPLHHYPSGRSTSTCVSRIAYYNASDARYLELHNVTQTALLRGIQCCARSRFGCWLFYSV